MCRVCIDDARGCDLSSIISVSTTSLGRDAPPLCSVGRLWLQQELILVRRNGEWRHKKNRRGPPWGGARSRLARSLVVSIRDDPELGTYFLKPPKCHITIYRFSYWARDPQIDKGFCALRRAYGYAR